MVWWVGLVVTAASIAASYLLRPNIKDRRTPGAGYTPDEGETDPTRRIGMGYGRPTMTAAKLSDALIPSQRNSTLPDPKPKRRLVVSLGSGEIDGGDVTLWLGNLLASDKVGSGAPIAERTLTPVGTDRRVWNFGATNVVEDSVEYYIDDAFYTVSGEATGGDTTEPNESTVNETIAVDGPSINRYIEFDPPVLGVIAFDSVEAWVISSGLFSRRQKVRVTRGYRDGKDFDPDYEFWRIDTKTEGIRFTPFIQSVEVKYRVKKYLNTPTYTKLNDGTVQVSFRDPLPDGVVTVTFRRSVFEKLTWKIQRGTSQEDAIADGNGTRTTNAVIEKLTQAAPISATSAENVDDVVLHLQSGSGGFYELGGQGQDRMAHRKIGIAVKTTSAPEQATSSKDPTQGWVPLAQIDGTEEFNVNGRTNGQANWFYSIGELLAQTVAKSASVGSRLPVNTYEVRVTALDDERVGNAGEPINAVDELFYAALISVQSLQLSVPRHARMIIESEDPDFLARTDSIRVGIRMRRVWVPFAGAVADPETGRPEPGELRWSRNPVLCAVDALLDPDFGGGDFWTWQNVDAPSLMAAAAFAEETVENADGTLETRAEVDGFFEDEQAAILTAADILRGSQVMLSVSGGILRFIPDRDAPAVLEITQNDYHQGDLTFKYPSIEDTANEITYTFTPESLDGDLLTEVRRLKGSDGEPTVPLRMDLSGVRRESQAARVIDLALAQNAQNRIAAEFIAVGWRLLPLEAGDIVEWTDPDYGFDKKPFRVMQTGYGSDLRPRLKLTEHNVAAYSKGWGGPVGGIPPGLRLPVDAQTGDTQTVESTTEDGDKTSLRSVLTRLARLALSLLQGSREYEIDVGDFPTGVKGFRLFYRQVRPGATAWQRVGEFYAPKAVVSGDNIFPEDDFDARAYPLDNQNRQGPGFREIRTSLRTMPIKNRRPLPEVVIDPDSVTQNGPTVVVGNPIPADEKAEEFEVEYRIGPDGGDPQDAIQVGRVPANDTVPIGNLPVAATIHTRVTRRDTEETSDWSSQPANIPEAAVPGVPNHSNGFSAGVIVPLAGNVLPAVVSGSPETLQRAPIYIDDLSSTEIYDATDIEIYNAGLYWSPLMFKTAVIDTGVIETAQLQLYPQVDLASSPRQDIEIWDAHWSIVSPSFDENRQPRDHLTDEQDLTVYADETPVRFDTRVATSTSGSPTFTDNDYLPYRTGQPLKSMRTYSVWWIFWLRFDRQIVFDYFWIYWWIYCLGRPWCLNSSASEFLYYEALTTPTDVVTTGSLDLAMYEYVDIEVRWIGATDLVEELQIFFNGDPGNAITLTPVLWDVGLGREEMTIRVRPPTGVHRSVRVASRALYDAAGESLDSTDSDTFFWEDVSTPLTSIQFRTNETNGIGAGSVFALYGKVLAG